MIRPWMQSGGVDELGVVDAVGVEILFGEEHEAVGDASGQGLRERRDQLVEPVPVRRGPGSDQDAGAGPVPMDGDEVERVEVRDAFRVDVANGLWLLPQSHHVGMSL